MHHESYILRGAALPVITHPQLTLNLSTDNIQCFPTTSVSPRHGGPVSSSCSIRVFAALAPLHGQTDDSPLVVSARRRRLRAASYAGTTFLTSGLSSRPGTRTTVKTKSHSPPRMKYRHTATTPSSPAPAHPPRLSTTTAPVTHPLLTNTNNSQRQVLWSRANVARADTCCIGLSSYPVSLLNRAYEHPRARASSTRRDHHH